MFDLIETRVFEAERLHGDDTTIPILAKGQCTTGRIWTYVCDDRPFGGPSPPAAVFYASSDRRGEHPQRHLAEFSGILQADCYNGFNPLFDRTRKQNPVTPAFCFAHARRKFFELADVSRSARRGKGLRPVSATALEAVRRIDALFAIEREINGRSAEDRLTVRQEKSKPLLEELEVWLRQEREGLSRSSPVIEPINYMLSRWEDFARYADDGRICMTNNAAERALRGVACSRKNWSFAGSDRGADRAAIMLTLITTARLNDVDPKAWLADVLARIADLAVSRLHELLPCWGVEGDQDDGNTGCRVNSFRKSASDRRRPSSVSTSDFALFTGSPIRPFRCKRSVVAQSKPFQAQRSLCNVSHNSASTASSILSSSISIPQCYHARPQKSCGPPRMDTVDLSAEVVHLVAGKAVL